MLAAIELDGVRGDVVFLAITVAFFGLTWLVVKLCDHISGTADASTFRVPETSALEVADSADSGEPVGAGAR